MERIKKYEPLWGKWTAKRIIGEGSFGAVYEVESEKFGNRSSCAVKLISFKNAEMLQGVKEGKTLSNEELEQLKIEEARKNVREAVLMEKLQGRDHIVTIHDYDIFPSETTTDVIIRMELLTNLNDYMKQHTTDSESDLKETVIKLGIDIGKALEDCEEEKIVHRDIKPDNIFVNKNKTFKLGDFGLSRKMSKSTSFSLRKSAGTPLYMAPEALGWGRKVDTLSDLYSLGIVMYQLLNEKNIPFVSGTGDFDEVDEAIEKRADGEEILAPKHENGQLWRIIQKSCQFEKDDRYQYAVEMRKDLEKLEHKEINRMNEEENSYKEKVVSRLKRAAEQGNTNAQQSLGLCYDFGNGVEKDWRKAEEWLKKAAELGQDIAMIHLAIHYEAKKDLKKTIYWYEKIAEKHGYKNDKEKVKELRKQLKVGEIIGYQYDVGESVWFGNYPQNIDGTQKPIEWIILKREGNKALLLSKYVLDAKKYNRTWKDITWETSSIRRWLNKDFYALAFNDIEQKRIMEKYFYKNDITDKVFLLSVGAVESLFKNDEERKAKATEYARKKGLTEHETKCSVWWLQSSDISNWDAPVVSDRGWISSSRANHEYEGVRPALWINL